MTDISLDLQPTGYISDQNIPVTSWRAYAEISFITTLGSLAPYKCLVDSGAPFSVVPHWLWKSFQVKWNPLGQQLTHQSGTTVPEALRWHDVDCTLGTTKVYINDPIANTRTSHPFIFIAKFANSPSQKSNLNSMVILGMNFLADNRLCFNLDGTGVDLIGKLTIP